MVLYPSLIDNCCSSYCIYYCSRYYLTPFLWFGYFLFHKRNSPLSSTTGSTTPYIKIIANTSSFPPRPQRPPRSIPLYAYRYHWTLLGEFRAGMMDDVGFWSAMFQSVVFQKLSLVLLLLSPLLYL